MPNKPGPNRRRMTLWLDRSTLEQWRRYYDRFTNPGNRRIEELMLQEIRRLEEIAEGNAQKCDANPSGKGEKGTKES